MNKSRIIGESVFEALESSNNAVRKAAQIMVNYAKDDGVVDPVTIYKAEQVLIKEAQISRENIWSAQRTVSTDTGEVKDFGVTRRLISESDSLTRSKLGDKGGNQAPVKPTVENIMACYKTK